MLQGGEKGAATTCRNDDLAVPDSAARVLGSAVPVAEPPMLHSETELREIRSSPAAAELVISPEGSAEDHPCAEAGPADAASKDAAEGT